LKAVQVSTSSAARRVCHRGRAVGKTARDSAAADCTPGCRLGRNPEPQ
jgi:hypothetical protein